MKEELKTLPTGLPYTHEVRVFQDTIKIGFMSEDKNRVQCVTDESNHSALISGIMAQLGENTPATGAERQEGNQAEVITILVESIKKMSSKPEFNVRPLQSYVERYINDLRGKILELTNKAAEQIVEPQPQIPVSTPPRSDYGCTTSAASSPAALFTPSTELTLSLARRLSYSSVPSPSQVDVDPNTTENSHFYI